MDPVGVAAWAPAEAVGNRLIRLFRFRKPRAERDEELIALILERLTAISKTAEAFAKGEYIQQLYNFDEQELKWSTLQYGFTLMLAFFGIVGTVAAAQGTGSGTWKTSAIIAGALVAALTALNQTWSPGASATAFKLGYSDLRAEGWEYLNWLGSYKQLRVTGAPAAADAPVPAAGGAVPAGTVVSPDSQAYDLFVEHVQGITKRAQSVTQKEASEAGK